MKQPSPPLANSPRMTMEDIAREAGVSKITVSRALSGHPLVKASTRARICQLAEAYGYRVNIAARNLRQQRTRTIAVVIEMTPSHSRSMSDPYPLSLLGGILQELTSRAYSMVLTTMPLFVASPPAADGVILLGQGVNEDAVGNVQRTGLPYVIWGSVDGNEDHITVGSDNIHGGVVAADHLFRQQRRRYVFIGDATHLEIADRLCGFRQGIARNACTLVDTIPSPFTREGGYSAITRLLAQDSGAFDGVFAASDAIAMGVIDALTGAGLAVPDAVCVIGFDDAPSAALSTPAISSIRQDWDRGGLLLAQKILELMADGHPVSEAMPVELKPRTT